MSTRKRPKGPRRKRMKLPARLQSAAHWLPTYPGKNVVKGYARWYGVDLLCAVKELRMLGVAVDPAYEEKLRQTARSRQQEATRRNAARTQRNAAAAGRSTLAETDELVWGGVHFAYVAGYTPGGAPYGVTWEELKGSSGDLADSRDGAADDEQPGGKPANGRVARD